MVEESETPDYYEFYDYDNENDTEESCPSQDMPQANWILPILYSVFFIVGFIGNVVVMIVLFKRSSRRADTFILNLAVSDFIFVLTLPMWSSSLALGGYWPFGIDLCRASGFIIAVSRCASSMLMAVMSVDRYLAVRKGQKVHPLRVHTCSFVTCCTIWAFSILTGVPTLIYRRIDNITLGCVEYSESPVYAGLKLSTVIITFVLPFLIVVFCYCSMAKYLWSYFGGKKDTANGMMKRRSRHSWLRIVFCVVAAYSLSWFPFTILNTVKLVSNLGIDLPCHLWTATEQALTAAAALAFANSCTNPLIYTFLDAGFRRRARQILPWLLSNCCTFKQLSIRGWSVSTTLRSMESTSYTDSVGRQSA
ncbi:probable G- coupled receptor 25 [Pelobates cultripes]|uniref:Probable G- coupled receptor 25 n=1 Tax=Pelobates cultripes TaxID=61616 RepID=A0AAD1R870_PELCU|nr:probable G- coupled receptor 25 [Pelobates cultripes]